MKALVRSVFICSVVAATSFAADTKPMGGMDKGMAADKGGSMAKAAPKDEITCGQWMASKAPLPAKLGELMASIADNMDSHAKWTSASKDKNAKKEVEIVSKVAKTHRDLGTNYTRLSEEMTKHKDLPAVQHDPKAMDMAKMTEGMTKQIKLQREMAQMIIKDADEAEAHLNQMKAHGGSGTAN
ncbi:MAG: hypothetical protein ACT4TC_11905 [Myxococcaceae bacterium]